ncbi:SRPBCC family protein [Mycobacterium sp.]|uniref:SRPBCC family protein n=1 Tax=Mycobacterium sp. TaxID=1785 RepID=UPI003C77E490
MAGIHRTHTIAAAPHEVWDVLADFGSISSWVDNVDHSCILNQGADSEPLMLQTTGHPRRRQPTVSLRRLSRRRAGTCRRR